MPVLLGADLAGFHVEAAQLRSLAQTALELGEARETGQAQGVIPEPDGLGLGGQAADYGAEERHAVRGLELDYPYCNAQLRAFQQAKDSLAEVDTKVTALSVDNESTTTKLIAKHGLQFPVGHSADTHALAEATGAFLNDDPLYVQSTGFVLGPTGRVVVSVYSSGAVGRLVPEDVVGFIRYLRQHAAADTA